MDNKKPDYVFSDNLEAILYLLITIAYPVFTYVLQIINVFQKVSLSLPMLLSTGVYFCFVFFLDFYSRYNNCSNNMLGKLLFGKVFFGIMSGLLIIIVLVAIFTPISEKAIMILFCFVPLFSIIPLIIVVPEIINRTKEEHNKRKISASKRATDTSAQSEDIDLNNQDIGSN